MCSSFAHNLIAAAALGGLLLAGCTATSSRPAPVNEAPAPVETTAGPRDMPAPEGPALFGDKPAQERVPFENRLVTKLRRHTFTTEGLDLDPDIAPDGATLVFASTRHAERPDIYLKRPAGTALTQLTGDPADDIQPCFGPDGEQVAFCSNRTGNWDLWLINRDGTGLTQLTQDRSDEVAPCWSPDGTQIAYTVWGHRAQCWEVWTLALDKPGVRRFLVQGMFPAWSPDGAQVAFQRARQRGSRWFSVWTVDLVDGEARRPTEIAHSDEAACISPCWSPDGTMLAYCTVRREDAMAASGVERPTAADLWSIELESGLRLKLTDGSASAFNPVWSPDGRIFFVSGRAGSDNVWSLSGALGQYAQGLPQDPRVSRAARGRPGRLEGD